MTTELTLREWRFGQTQAERLCAGVLSIEGFSAVDPQHPLGGPDGLKDVLCRRGIASFVAAAYFPTGVVSFREVKKKFVDDIKGVERNGANGFVFFVNQALTIGERKTLRELAGNAAHPAELYHLERLRSALDAPRGCGLRLEYLDIAMTHEEQLAYWSTANVDLSAKLDRIEQLQYKTIEEIRASEDDILRRTTNMLADLRSTPSSGFGPPPPAGRIWQAGPATADLSLAMVKWLHRVLLSDSGLPDALLGELRGLTGAVGPADDPQSYVPPQPEELRDLMTKWCERWRAGYAALENQNAEARLVGIVEAYHSFLRIHPFADGNGRTARAILDQMLRELLGTSLPQKTGFTPLEHQGALQSADAGNLEPLVDQFRLALN